MTKRHRTFAVLMILLLGVGLRGYRLGFQSLWNDEVITYQISVNKPSIIVTNPPGDVRIPPLFNFIKVRWARDIATVCIHVFWLN